MYTMVETMARVDLNLSADGVATTCERYSVSWPFVPGASSMMRCRERPTNLCSRTSPLKPNAKDGTQGRTCRAHIVVTVDRTIVFFAEIGTSVTAQISRGCAILVWFQEYARPLAGNEKQCSELTLGRLTFCALSLQLRRSHVGTPTRGGNRSV